MLKYLSLKMIQNKIEFSLNISKIFGSKINNYNDIFFKQTKYISGGFIRLWFENYIRVKFRRKEQMTINLENPG